MIKVKAFRCTLLNSFGFLCLDKDERERDAESFFC